MFLDNIDGFLLCFWFDVVVELFRYFSLDELWLRLESFVGRDEHFLVLVLDHGVEPSYDLGFTLYVLASFLVG